MKCSPFSRGLRKGGKHMHRRFMKHLKRRGMNDYESSSSSSSSEDCHRYQIESDNDAQPRMNHDHGMKHGMRHGRGMMHRSHSHDRRHDHGMRQGRSHSHDRMDGMRHDYGMMHGRRHSHDRMHGTRHDHGMMHGRRHGHMLHGMRHGHDMLHGMRHDHGMMDERRHGHGMKHGKRQAHFMEHRMRHRHGMKHKMHHGHGRKHKMGHGPGMHHKLSNRNEGRPLEVDTENMQDKSESDAFTFYEPKTKAQVMSENNRFQITLETSYYQPEEVSVKIADGQIDVSAMHESMENDLYEFHEMYRSFDIPDNVNPEVISARLDTEGKLIIEAACNDQEENLTTERDIPVIRVSE